MLDVCLLGVSGMMPLPDRYLTSLLVRINGKKLLIDCGEGTQVTAKILGWGFKSIDVICFTHLHADHIAGLPGFLLTIGNSGRTEPLTIIGPKGIANVYEGLSTIFPEIPFEVKIKELFLTDENPESEEINLGEFSIKAMFMDHRIPCFSYVVELKRKGKFSLEKAEKLNLPKALWSLLQKGENVIYKEKEYTPNMVLGTNRKGIKIAYCTDSRPLERMHKFIENADLFICEGMYGEEEKKENAIAKKHMIFSEAATMAKEGNVKELWLTHFSPALAEPELYLENATKIFENTVIGKVRLSKKFLFEE
ncbi:MAG: ribonuclease Z [Eubacteriales bacterium]|nr:ribonuclease Z [Eubacteriales bacterium]